MCADLCESQREKERNNETKIESTTCEEKKKKYPDSDNWTWIQGEHNNTTFNLVLPQTH